MSAAKVSTILVVRDQVYVKSANGLFYAATVEEKRGSCFVVRFGDNSRRLVPETELTWLGFSGLAGSMWPRRLDIQTRDNESRFLQRSELAFIENKNGQRSVPEFFTLHESREEITDSRGLPTNAKQQCLSPVIPHRAAWEQEFSTSQPRSTVLRLNQDLLERENPPDSFDDQYSSFSQEFRVPENSSVSQYNKYGKLRNGLSNHGCANRNLLKLNQRKRKTGIDIYDDELQSKNDHRFTANDDEEDKIANNTKIRSLSVITSSHFDETFRRNKLSCSDKTQQTFRKDSQIYKERGIRKKESIKKCRKVFGIKNRQEWCVQCRWKKACSRFKVDQERAECQLPG